MTALKVGQEVKVQVLEVDYERGRISLTAKTGQQANRSSQNSGERPRTQSGKPQKELQTPAPSLKNNAFAGLKNLKL
jgi:uncharacterized protein